MSCLICAESSTKQIILRLKHAANCTLKSVNLDYSSLDFLNTVLNHQNKQIHIYIFKKARLQRLQSVYIQYTL